MVKIIQYMEKRGFESISIARRSVVTRPSITPAYVMRKLDELSVFHGILELPSINNLLFYRFRPGDYRFSGNASSYPGASAASRSHGSS